jgi:hypothetical protein
MAQAPKRKRRAAEPAETRFALTVPIGSFALECPRGLEIFFRRAFGAEHALDDVLRALSRPPSLTTMRVNTAVPGVTRAIALARLIAHLDAAGGVNDRLRAARRAPLVPQPHATIDDCITVSSSPCLGAPLPVGGATMAVAEVIVDRVCGEAVLRGADVFVRGVVGASAGIEVGQRVCVTVDLERTLPMGSYAARFAGRRVAVGHGVAMLSRKSIASDRKGVAVQMTDAAIGCAPPMNGVLDDILFLQVRLWCAAVGQRGRRPFAGAIAIARVYPAWGGGVDARAR